MRHCTFVCTENAPLYFRFFGQQGRVAIYRPRRKRSGTMCGSVAACQRFACIFAVPGRPRSAITERCFRGGPYLLVCSTLRPETPIQLLGFCVLQIFISFMHTVPIVQDDLPLRLRTERERLGLKQVELAKLTGISRGTQVSYEAGKSEPTTGYLKKLKRAGGDINFLLFGSEDYDEFSENAISTLSVAIDWKLVQECTEAVDFFFLRSGLNCPSRFRWKLVKKVHSEVTTCEVQEPSRPDLLDLVSRLWEDYEHWASD
ncbi:helix-turn-helix domain-containing protein [Delftia lacustris]|uniref:Transcriptional regulator, contains XRE-family HTH domain n=2 Tax=Delftia lacustris TaxID=558537 RepID=A0A1H3N4W7_9BURK|nr:Transcriptional regulator, contains XRE-family HTH domain [Delftia lacustris]